MKELWAHRVHRMFSEALKDKSLPGRPKQGRAFTCRGKHPRKGKAESVVQLGYSVSLCGEQGGGEEVGGRSWLVTPNALVSAGVLIHFEELVWNPKSLVSAAGAPLKVVTVVWLS